MGWLSCVRWLVAIYTRVSKRLECAMPNFNYGAAVNVYGQTLESSEDKLFDFAREVIVREGRTALTLDLCRNAGFTEELLSEFKSSDELLEATVHDLIRKIEENYDHITEESRTYLGNHRYTEDESYQKLQRLLNRHIWLVFNPKNRSYVLLASNEVMLSESDQKAVNKAIQEHFTDVLYQLILTAGQIKNERLATLLTVTAISDINIFVQQPELCKRIFKAGTRLEPNYSEIQDYVNNVILRNIHTNLSINCC